jgi:hypothetical protein
MDLVCLKYPLVLLFLGCWAAIAMRYALQRWDAELKAKHAELGARAVPDPVMVRPALGTAAYRMTTPAISAIPDQRS